MNSERAIFLLNLLGANCVDDADLSIISDLYNAAIEDDSRYKDVCKALSNLVFRGSSAYLRQEALALVEQFQKEPTNAIESLVKASRINNHIEQDMQLTKLKLVSSTSSNEPAMVLTKEEYSTWKETLGLLTSVCLYQIAKYCGIDKLDSTIEVSSREVQDLLLQVNSFLLPIVKSIDIQDKRRWIIWRKPVPVNLLLSEGMYSIEYYSDDQDLHFFSVDNGVPIVTSVFYKPEAFRKLSSPTPCCWGRGNILSIQPQDAELLWRPGIVKKLRTPLSSDYSMPLTSPKECLNRLSNNNPYCISPVDLAINMDVWDAEYEINARRKNGICLMCGKPSKDGYYACMDHFGV